MTDLPDDRTAVPAGVPVDELSYTQASRELDEIVRFFEQRDVDVDQLVGRLVRATALVEELDKRLRHTRMQVEQLVPRLAAVLSDAPPAPSGSVAAGPEDGAPGEDLDTSDRTMDDDDLADLDEEDLHDLELAETGDPSFATGDDDGSTPELF